MLIPRNDRPGAFRGDFCRRESIRIPGDGAVDEGAVNGFVRIWAGGQAAVIEVQTEPAAEPVVEPAAEPAPEPVDEPETETVATPAGEVTDAPTEGPAEEATEEPAEAPGEAPEAELTAELAPEATVEGTDAPLPEATVEPTVHFSAGYVQIAKGTAVYANVKRTKLLGKIVEKGCAYAELSASGENPEEDWLKLTFDTPELRETGAALATGYIQLKNVEALSEAENNALIEGLGKVAATRTMPGNRLPAPCIRFAFEPAEDVVVVEPEANLAAAVTITKQPANVTAILGATAKVSVTAKGEGLTYTWYGKDTGDSAFWRSSVTTASYSVTMSDARNGRKLYCVVKDQYGNTEKSNVVTLQKFAITKQPVDASTPLNGKVSVSVGATGSNLKYTWYCKDPADSAYWKSGVTSSTYGVELTAARVGRMLYCVVSDGNGNSIRSDTATILWFRILRQPVNAYGYEGDEVSVSLDVSGAGLKYVWYYRNATDDDFKRSSVTTPTYTMIMDLSRSGRQVYCVVTDNGGNTLTSHVAAVSMLAGKDPYEDNERYVYDVYDLVNEVRSQNGLVAYSVNEGLMEAAAIRAREITEVFDHVRPDGSMWYTVHCDAYGENIAYGYGTPESVMNG